MQGIYVHIPFCKQACHYCNFHFNTNLNSIDEMVKGILLELELRKDYLRGKINSIYIGGGTPSLLKKEFLDLILKFIFSTYELENQLEITIEVNPDDITAEKLKDFYELGINRLSIGIQSFNDDVLKYLNRAHNSQKAIESFFVARNIGFDNISIDLIYGIPKSNIEIWKNDIAIATDLLRPDHISSYCLTIEKNTFFGTMHSRGKFKKISSDKEAALYDILIEALNDKGYEQYEVSNFCLPNKFSNHNTNYWKKGNYLGIGPSAHSYDGFSRQWNISNNKKYIESLKANIVPFIKEILTKKDHINEYIMTSLRTKWGCDLNFLKDNYGYDLLNEAKNVLENLINSEYIYLKDNTIKATQKGFKLCDEITANLFLS